MNDGTIRLMNEYRIGRKDANKQKNSKGGKKQTNEMLQFAKTNGKIKSLQ